MDIVRLSQINHRLDPIVQFDYDDDDKKHNPFAIAAGATAAGGAVYGGYRANQAIRTRQGAMNAVVPGAKTSYASAAQNLYRSGAQKAKIGIESATKSSGQWMEKLLSKLRGVKLASKTERLVQLNQALAEVIEFVTPDERYKHQTPENNTARGIGMGLLGGSWPGAIAGAQDARKFRKANIVYRKRDALGNSLGGAVIGGVAGGAAIASGIGRLKHGALGAGIGSIAVGYGAQRLLAAHTLKKRQGVYAER